MPSLVHCGRVYRHVKTDRLYYVVRSAAKVAGYVDPHVLHLGMYGDWRLFLRPLGMFSCFVPDFSLPSALDERSRNLLVALNKGDDLTYRADDLDSEWTPVRRHPQPVEMLASRPRA